MGNCQAAEVAALVIQHPGNGKVEKMYWSVSANEVMSSNPGYYVALVVPPPGVNIGQLVKNNQLKLLRPDDIMHIGHVYRLISFQDVIKEFTLKKSVKLGKLLKDDRVLGDDWNSLDNAQVAGNGSIGVRRNHGGLGQWRPALQSIAEL